MREITIKFNVVGTCCQTIEIDNRCELTNEEIIEGLEKGVLFTGVLSGKLYKLSDDSKLPSLVVGTVDGCDIECEYDDFEDVSF